MKCGKNRRDTALANDKEAVAEFWNRASCGEELYLKGDEREHYLSQARARYRLEPYIAGFADFAGQRGKNVLEIGVGLGADHQEFAMAGALLHGCDLTPRAVEHTRRRLQLFGLQSELRQADAEDLPYANDSFDLVYSWGVLHHSPRTSNAIAEVHRVLKPGGQARVMVYHKYSFVGYMLWVRYALLRGKWTRSLKSVYAEHLESPGTKAYSVDQARRLFSQFQRISIETVLTHGDLLSSGAGQRHRGLLLTVARNLWPRWAIRALFPRHGLFMLISAEK